MKLEEKKQFLIDAKKKTEELYSKYDFISTLENGVLDNTSIYDDALINLQQAIEEEKMLYIKQNFNYDDLSNLLNILSNEINFYDFDSPLSERIFHLNDQKDLIYERIYRRMVELIDNAKDKEEWAKLIVNRNLFPNLKINNINNVALKSKLIKEYLYSDYFLMFLAFIEDFLERKNISEKTKTFLRKIKYKISMIFPNVESILLKNNLKPEKNIYLGHEMAADFMGVSEVLQKEEFNLYGRNEVINHMIELLDISDDEIDLKNEEIIMRLFFMRSGFLLMTEDAITESNDFFHDIVDDRNYSMNGNKTIDMISNTYSQIKRDKGLHYHLSLKKPRS